MTLYEKGTELGGQNNLASRIRNREYFGEVTRWQRHELYKAGVEVHLGTEATTEMVLQERPDAVVVATGSKPLRTGYSSHRSEVMELPGVEQDNVLTVWDVFADRERVGQRVVLIDEDPIWRGYTLRRSWRSGGGRWRW